MVIAITHTGYIKSLPLATYRQQQRGGRGVTGMDMKDGDFIEHLFVCSSHDSCCSSPTAARCSLEGL